MPLYYLTKPSQPARVQQPSTIGYQSHHFLQAPSLEAYIEFIGNLQKRWYWQLKARSLYSVMALRKGWMSASRFSGLTRTKTAVGAKRTFVANVEMASDPF